MRVYLDNCCYNRPFDPQTDLRIHLETVAKVRVQTLMKSGAVEYVWSDALDLNWVRVQTFKSRT